MAEEGAVAVCVRVRPLNSREESLGETAQVYWKTDNNAIYQVDGSKSFNFDRVFHGNETTKNVYEEIAAPIIDSAIQGYNGTIFAYGQTASGKTYTMMGSEDHLGVTPRAIHDIFQKIKKFPDREFLLRVSYMEIYNETITDLLCGTQKMKPLIIREDVNRNVYVADLTEEVVYTSEMALKWITKGEKNRHYGETKMNQRSSRSHTIFRMILESREKGEPSNCEGSVKVSHLNLVDLAGSERAAQTGAEGVRLKEGCNINRSLFILGQVIKKLSDGQVGGFINYRDSKLTRILQNSLGGNAKTRIICTITPVSFDETLSTLQFASTAKYMKNTPYVNEVSTDEALLKRYRKEIMDLKKQLEEVSLETRAQAMEKDQLAQLLEEKDLLQKVQNEKIENLTRMLVTSSSLTSQQELKAKRKRRVTWCLGKINKMKNSNYVDQFNMPTNITTKTHKLSVNLLGEIDESVCSESDVFSNTLDTLNEIEWNPATKLLNQENIESELNSLRADYDNLVLDYEQLRTEKEEMELKLKEKNDLDEFEALERKTKKDQEMQLIHEISNLKNLVKHAEVYNQDLENELSSKVELLREKEDQIKKLQEYIDSQKLENIKMDLSYSLESIEDQKQMKQTLFDAETVALDAKRESAFLRSENLELKEKMQELASTYKQMENDIQLYQSQLEAKKKMQVDLEKELQSAFNEITKLTSLIDGKVPKDLLYNLELEGKITDLQKELNKEVEENEALQKEVNLLSELKSLPSEVERLRKEIHDKSEELYIITSEKDKLFSEVVHKESRVQGLLEEIGKTKDDLATTQSNYKNTDQEFQNFKSLHMDFEQKYKMVLEENARMNQEIVNLSKEAQKFDSSLDALKTELSYKTQELQKKTCEVQERLNEMEELKEQLENRDSTLQTVEREKTLITEKLQQTLEEVKTLTQEKDDLKQLQESLQIERDQLKSDIHDTINMNIDTQEQLRNALESLKQHQETINTLKLKISEEVSRNLHMEESTGETKDEFQQKMVGIDKKQDLEAKNTQTLTADVKDDEIIEQQRKIFSLIQEKNELQQVLESVIAEKEQLKTDLKENIEMTIENQEELRILGDELKKQQEIVAQEKNHTIKKEEELSRTCDRLAEVEEKLKEKIQESQSKQEQSLNMKEKDNETTKILSEMEEFKPKDSALLRIEIEMLRLSKRLQESHDEMKSVAKEKDDLQRLQEVLQSESDQLKENIKEIAAKHLETEEELKVVHCCLKEQKETIDELRVNISEKETEISAIQKELEAINDKLQNKIQEIYKKEGQLNIKRISETQEKVNELKQFKEHLKAKDSTLQSIESKMLELTSRLQESQEEIQIMIKEKEEMKRVQEALQIERDQLQENTKEIIAKMQESQEKEYQFLKMTAVNETQEKMCEIEHLKEQFETQKLNLENIETENIRLTQILHENLEEMRSVTKERDDLRSVEETLKVERDQLKENLRETITRDLEKQEELKIVHMHLKEHQETIDELRGIVSEKTNEISNMQKDLENSNAALKAQDLKKQEELRIAHMHLKEHQETIDKLRGIVSEKTDKISNMQKDLENSNAKLQEKIQELKANEHQLFKLKKDVNETQKKVSEMEQLKKQIKDQSLTLSKIETENLNLAQKLHENLEEMKSVMKERDNLRRVEETLKLERDQLMESLQETKARDLEIQQELKTAHMLSKEHKETIDKLREKILEKATQISNIQKDLDKSKDELQKKIQELRKKELHLLRMKEDVNMSHKKINEMEQLKKQFEAQNLSMQNVRMDNFQLTKKLHESLEEIRIVAKERDELRRIKESLKMERDQFIATLREMIARDQQNHQVKPEKRLLSDGQQHLTESLREKCSRIKELLKRYSEMDDHYECLNRLSLDLEKEIEIQKELSMRVKANLSLPYLQTKHIEKLFTANQRCSMEFHRIMKKLKYVLSYVTKIKEEQHESINKFEMDFIDEVEKQKELLIKIQHLQQDCDVPSRELRDLKLNQNMDLHTEEILKDFSESEFPTIKTEFQQILSNRKEMTQFLEEWLNTRFDIEKLKNGIQKENDRICQMNNFFNNRIIAIMNESTEFEERSATISKEWEQDLKSLKEKNEKLFKNYQTLKTSLASGAQVNPTTQDNKNPHVTSRATQLTTEKIRELENSLHEAKESAMHKESKIIKMQKELEVTNDMIAKLQAKVNESNKCLETTKETIQVLQDKVALGAKPYKEEIEDLKTKLVKIDLEKMKNAKEFEKEISATKATVEYQKEVIRLLRENLRRSQQAQDTSMISEHTDSQPSNKPLTCGGGSGIVQNTKALILKSEHIRLEKEISKLKQQNEQLIKQKNDLLSNNQHLSNEVKTWKERTLKREAYKQVTCENSPKSPKVTGTASKKKQITPSQCKERNLHDPTPKESPKSWFFDSRSKSLPSPHPVRYFDNSNLGLCPEVQNAGAESVDSQPGPWHASSGKDVPECKTQ
ncbi:PREDICTED: centromere-associated protein E isoform X12 [Cercocebus atys]|uniref:centromere-associated protein E isoform X12 n=1 Tax=Cercocebus atys TaxID=9531 RepID=UPI0005F3FD71|nr:PREDICTED: centromere-associated protein E isoform X12 [Cercocebus atys]